MQVSPMQVSLVKEAFKIASGRSAKQPVKTAVQNDLQNSLQASKIAGSKQPPKWPVQNSRSK
jgi:hypothetical protein